MDMADATVKEWTITAKRAEMAGKEGILTA
jgi:hypothetical protein